MSGETGEYQSMKPEDKDPIVGDVEEGSAAWYMNTLIEAYGARMAEHLQGAVDLTNVMMRGYATAMAEWNKAARENELLRNEVDQLNAKLQLAREEQRARTVVIPKEAEVLGPSNSQQWLNGNRVRRYRKLAGLRQWELGGKVGLAQAQVSILERTGYVVGGHGDLAPALAAALGCTEAELRTRYVRNNTEV